MEPNTSRRQFLRGAAMAAAGVAAAGALAACASADDDEDASPSGTGSGEFEGENLTLLVYSGLTERLYKEHFVPQFRAATGANAVIDSAWTEGIARLQAAPAGNPPFDAVLTDPTQGLPAIKAGLFQQFDTDKITNAKGFAPELLETSVWTDGYGLPFHSSAMTLVTNTSLHAEPYQTWAQLLEDRPEAGIMMYNLPYMSMYTFAAIKAEQEGKVGQAAQMLEDDPDGVTAFALANRDAVKYWWASTAPGVEALLRGEVAAGNMHGNGVLTPIREGKPVKGVIPPGDIAYAQLFFTVPTGVRNPELSIAAINHVASREFQTALAASGEYSAAIPEVAEAQAAKDPVWAAAFPHSEADFEKLEYYPYEALANENMVKVFNEQIVRK